MNYRHSFHAGNFADVLKHAVLALVIEHLKLKDAAFRVIDTHAGVGHYDLAADAAERTGEWRDGIGRLLGPGATPLPAGVAAILAPYLDVVRASNPAGGMMHYPGSPLIVRTLMRRQDRLLLTELHPEDCRTLAARFARDRQVKVLELDGWLALKSFLPPKERRGVVLIDPPFEERDELARLARGLKHAIDRFATGTFILWYPIKAAAGLAAFRRSIAALGLPKLLRIEHYIRAPAIADRLNGDGLLILNPPFTLQQKLEVVLPFLADRLARGAGAGWELKWIGNA